MCLGAVLSLALVSGCHAQMYSWKDPATGMPRMSNFPPPWYKGSVERRNAGPRTVVTMGMQVLDDTAKQITDEEFVRIRQRIAGQRGTPSEPNPSAPAGRTATAAQPSLGTEASTTGKTPEARQGNGNSPQPEVRTAADQARLDAEDDRQEMARERALRAR